MSQCERSHRTYILGCYQSFPGLSLGPSVHWVLFHVQMRTIPSSVVAILASAGPDIIVEFNSSGLLGTAPGVFLPLYPTRFRA